MNDEDIIKCIQKLEELKVPLPNYPVDLYEDRYGIFYFDGLTKVYTKDLRLKSMSLDQI